MPDFPIGPKTTGPSRSIRWHTVAACLLLVCMVLVVFIQCREFGFVDFDDDFIVFKNKQVLKGLTWENVLWSLTAGVGRNATDADYWRPLSLMSHMLDVSLFGLNAGAHHMMSVVLHALTAALLFLVLRAMTGAFWRAVFVAALFAVHPLHVESVAWVAERKDVLSGLFFMLTLFAYHRYSRLPFRWGACLLFLLMGTLAMMSKPMLVTLPGVLLLLDFWPLRRTSAVTPVKLLVEKNPLMLMAAFVAVLTINAPGLPNAEFWATFPKHYLAGNALMSYATYIRQTLWPAGLACFYSHPIRNVPPGGVAAAVLILAIITMLAWRFRRKPGWLVGWLWYLGMLLPVIGLFTQAGDQAHADRYTYLAMIGLSIMVVWPAVEWAGSSRSRRMLLGGGAVAAIAACMVAARAQVAHWRDTISLWSHAVACYPADAAANANLGTALLVKGETQSAISLYEHALALNPNHATARLNLGIMLLQLGRNDEAARHLRQAIMNDPKSASAHNGLGLILLQKGDRQQAIHHFQMAVDIRPDISACYNLGHAQLQAGRTAEAIDTFLRGLAANPDHIDSHFSVAVAYAAQGRRKAAVEHYDRALASNPDHLPSLNNLGWLLATSKDASLRDGAKAVKLIEHAFQLPGGSRIHLLHTLAAAYAEAGEYPKAVATAQQAMQIAQMQNAPDLARQLQLEINAYLTSTPWRE